MNNIQLNIIANAQFQQVYAEVAKLKEAMLSLQKASVGGPFTPQVTASIKQAQNAFDSAVLSTRAFTVEHVAMSSSVEKFGKQLKAGQLSLSNYYKIWRDSAKGVSSELDALATSQARLNRSIAIADPLRPGYAKLVTDINGVVTAQEKQLFYQKALNTALQQGSIKLIDFGKNTQWMGRQLTVGLTMPLAMFGAGVSSAFLQVDKELTRMQKVYGTGLIQPTQAALKQIRADVTALGTELAKTLGTSVQETASMAADLAATGLEGAKLIGGTREAIRLATLGELDHQQAMQATVALQNVYKLSTEGLSDAVNFLNAVENQTSTSLQDLVDAIPRVGPIVQQLGGSFKDTAAMMVSMKEAGVPAAQGANAIKSALGSLINPTTNAQKAFKAYNIDLQQMIGETGGKPILMFKALAESMKNLDRVAQAQLIEKLFGKYQFARIQALLDNINKSGSQTATVFNLMGASSADLAKLADKELKTQTESASGRFKRMVESLKADFLPIGNMFLNSFTRIGNVVDKVISAIRSIANVLGPTAKMFGNLFGGGLAGLIVIGPIIMMTGLFANLIGNILRGANAMRMFKQGMDSASATENKFLAGLHGMRNFYEDLDKSAIAARNQMDLMPEAITSNAKAFDILRQSIFTLTEQFTALAVAQREAMGFGAVANPLQMKFPGMATGGWVPGNPSAGDVYPAMLTGKEAVIPYPNSVKHASIVDAIMNDNLPKYSKGKKQRVVNDDTIVKGYGNLLAFLPQGMQDTMSKGGVAGTTIAEQVMSQGSGTFAPTIIALAKEMGLSVKEFQSEFHNIAQEFTKVTVTELEAAGAALVTDPWVEKTIVPRLKEVASTMEIAGKNVGEALVKVEENIRTASVVGIGSGASGGEGRMPISYGKGEPVSYKSTRVASQQLAMQFQEIDQVLNGEIAQTEKAAEEVFRSEKRFSESRQKWVTEFKVWDKAAGQSDIAAQSHLSTARELTFKKLQEEVQNLGGNVTNFVNKFKLKFDTSFREAINVATQSHSPSEIGRQAGLNMGAGLVKGVQDPKAIQQAQAAGTQIASAEIKGVAQEIPAAVAVGARLGAAEVSGAALGGSLGGGLDGSTGSGKNSLSFLSKYKNNYSIAARSAKGAGLLGKIGGKLGLGGLMSEGGMGGMKLGLAAMLAPMALNMIPNKIGGTNVSGAKDILGTTASVTGMAAMIPGMQFFLPEIAAATAGIKTLMWAFGRAQAATKKFEQGVRDSYAKIEHDPDQFISKIQNQLQLQDVQGKKYKDLSIYGKVYGDTMRKTMNDIGSGALKGKQLQTTLNALRTTTRDASTQFKLIKLSATQAGDTKLTGLINEIEKVKLKGNQAVMALANLQMMGAAGIDVAGFIAKNGAGAAIDKKALIGAYDEQIKSVKGKIYDANHPVVPGGAGNQKAQDALKKQIKQQEEVKKNLEDQLKIMQHQADVINRQNEYLNKQSDLTQQIKQAEITGNYIQAAQLRNVQGQQTSQYRQQQAIDKQQAKVDAQQELIDGLNAQLQKLQDIAAAAEQTAANTANTKELQAQLKQLLADKKAIESDQNKPDGSANKPLNVNVMTFDPKAAKGVGMLGGATGTVTDAELQKAKVKQRQVLGSRGYVSTYEGVIFTGADGKQYRIGASDPRMPGMHYITEVPSGQTVNKPHKASGGPITGRGTWTSDSIPAMLSQGEFVMNAAAVNRYGLGAMYAMNNRTLSMPMGGGSNQEINFYINGVNDPHAVADMVMQKLKTVNAKINKTNMVIK